MRFRCATKMPTASEAREPDVYRVSSNRLLDSPTAPDEPSRGTASHGLGTVSSKLSKSSTLLKHHILPQETLALLTGATDDRKSAIHGTHGHLNLCLSHAEERARQLRCGHHVTT